MVDRAVSPRDSKTRGEDIPLLQNIVGDQQTALRKQAQHFRQKPDILAFGRVHKDQVKGSVFMDPGKYVRRIAFEKFDGAGAPVSTGMRPGRIHKGLCQAVSEWSSFFLDDP